MKKLFLIFGLSLILFVPGIKATAETVKITTGEWKPFISEEFKHGGVILHIVREAFTRKGIDVQIGFFPWPRAVKYVNDGSWDTMAVTASRHSGEGERNLYSDAVYIGGDVVFHHKDNHLRGNSLADMKGLRFGAVLSYDYTDEYRNAVEDGSITEVIVPDPDLLFPMLVAKGFDVFVMDKTAGLYTYNTKYRGKSGDVIRYLEQSLATFEYSVRFSGDSEKNQRLIKIFNASLKEMKEAGTIDQYYRDFEEGAYLNP